MRGQERRVERRGERRRGEESGEGCAGVLCGAHTTGTRATAKERVAGGAAGSQAVTPVRTIVFEGGVPYDKLQHGHSLRRCACRAPCGAAETVNNPCLINLRAISFRSSMIDFRHTDGKMVSAHVPHQRDDQPCLIHHYATI